MPMLILENQTMPEAMCLLAATDDWSVCDVSEWARLNSGMYARDQLSSNRPHGHEHVSLVC